MRISHIYVSKKIDKRLNVRQLNTFFLLISLEMIY